MRPAIVQDQRNRAHPRLPPRSPIALGLRLGTEVTRCVRRPSLTLANRCIPIYPDWAKLLREALAAEFDRLTPQCLGEVARAWRRGAEDEGCRALRRGSGPSLSCTRERCQTRQGTAGPFASSSRRRAVGFQRSGGRYGPTITVVLTVSDRALSRDAGRSSEGNDSAAPTPVRRMGRGYARSCREDEVRG